MKVPFLNLHVSSRNGVVMVAREAQSIESLRWPTNQALMGWPIYEANTGNWQRNLIENPSQQSILAFSAVYACVTGIASDVAKMRIKLDKLDSDGIWNEITEGSPFLPVLRKPNHYQTRIKFLEQWIVSKLLWGNAYVLKQRDQRGIVTALYVLHPSCVSVMVAPDGSIFYQLKRDYLSEQPEESVMIPASEIIHDTMVSLFHPLVGVSPLFACATSTTMGVKIQANSANFFTNFSRPSGILTAPGEIGDETAVRLKAAFEANFGGTNVGRIAVLGDGLKFEGMTMPAEQAQLIEQLKFTVEDVARAFHYPLSKLGTVLPSYAGNVVESSQTAYYSDCLQIHIESIELLLDEGLALPTGMGTELDMDCLLRMDTLAQIEAAAKEVGAGIGTPNEARLQMNKSPVKGGDSPYLQQQNFSLEALAKRDALPDPFAGKTPVAAPAAPKQEESPVPTPERAFDAEDFEALLAADFRKELVTC